MTSIIINTSVDQHNKNTLTTRVVKALYASQALVKSSKDELRIFPVANGMKKLPHNLNEAEVTQCNIYLNDLATHLELVAPRFVYPIPEAPLSLEKAISNCCGLELEDWSYIANSLYTDSANEIDLKKLKQKLDKCYVETNSLPCFEVYSKGSPANEAVILIPPCGVPASLFHSWLESFGKNYYSLTLENPYLFNDWRLLPDPEGEFSQEVEYIGAILKEKNINRAHLIGICGGAPIAIAAAAKFIQQVESIILCHGDLNFGLNTPRSSFQSQFQGLLSESVNSVSRAKEVYSLFQDPAILFGVPTSICPLILYPYADFNLFQRYAKINSGLMAFNATESIHQINQPMLIITSRDDRMTHPGSSLMLHELVEGSNYWERETGNHHDTLLGSKELFTTITNFLQKNDVNQNVKVAANE